MGKTMRIGATMQVVPSDEGQAYAIDTLNRQFALVDIILCYHGRNRNKTLIPKEVIDAALPSLYGVPIVGEYIYLNDGSRDFGGHGGRIVVSESGVEFEDTTRPYGFITREAVDGARWETVLEKDGHTSHEYLELGSCVIWTERYAEVSALLDRNYGQSMEIEIDRAHEEDGYLVVDEMTFSAACILGSNPDGTGVEPCFESASIGRHYGLDSFRREYERMMEEYGRFIRREVAGKVNGKGNLEEAVSGILRGVRADGGDGDRYAVLSVAGGEACVIDMADGYKALAIPYSAGDGGEACVDFSAARETGLGPAEGDCRAVAGVIESEASRRAGEAVSAALAEYESKAVGEAVAKCAALEEQNAALRAEADEARARLEKYDAQRREEEAERHKAEIDAVVESYSARLGANADYLLYRANVDYSKTREQVDTDMLILLGRATMGQKSDFSYSPVVTSVGKDPGFDFGNGGGRYGDLFEKVKH